MTKRNSGFTLIEFLIVVALIIVGSIAAMRAKVSEAEESVARAAGQQMKEVGVDAMTAYMITNYQNLVANPNTTITVNDLVTDGFLPQGFNGVSPWGSTYQIQFRRTGTAPGWNLEALTLLSSGNGKDNVPIKDHLVGTAVDTIGAAGGLSESATTFRMYGGSTDATASANFPGVTFTGNQLGAKISYGSSIFNQFVRRDGSLSMTGPNPLNFDAGGAGKQNIVGANDIATNTVTIPAAGDINFGPRARKLSWLLPRLVEMEGYYVSDGQNVPKPVCDTGGQQSVVLAGVSTRGQVYPGDSMAHVRLFVENSGGNWIARVKGWDLATAADGGGGFPSAFARTFCFYP